MRTGQMFCYLLQCTVVISILAIQEVDAQQAPGNPDDQPKIGDTTVAAILERLGARLENGITPDQQDDYSRLFDLVDRDGDGRHSKQEYIEKGNYLTPQSRRGIFNAADNDGDGFVTQAEYILNRIITDEAKAIVQAMDGNKDGVVQRGEFIQHATAKLSDAELAKQIFAALDTDNNGEILVPEYLRVWGQWARAERLGPKQRIATRESELRKSPQVGARERQPSAGRPNGPPFGRAGQRAGQRAGPPSVADVFARFDANKDGKLQQGEVPEFVQQFIFPADTNKDQAVTKQELETFRGSRGAGRPGGRGRPLGGNVGAFGPFSGNTDPVRLSRRGLSVGFPLPELVVFDADGKAFNTSNLKGSYSVLVFGCLT